MVSFQSRCVNGSGGLQTNNTRVFIMWEGYSARDPGNIESEGVTRMKRLIKQTIVMASSLLLLVAGALSASGAESQSNTSTDTTTVATTPSVVTTLDASGEDGPEMVVIKASSITSERLEPVTSMIVVSNAALPTAGETAPPEGCATLTLADGPQHDSP